MKKIFFTSFFTLLTVASTLTFISTPLEAQANPSAFTDSFGQKFVLISAGQFNMGGVWDFDYLITGEGPQHRVEITKPFYLSAYEVTQELYGQIMGQYPSHFKGRLNPVESVSWNEVNLFIDKLNKSQTGPKRYKYRLPSEAEWEYAVRAGTSGVYFFGDEPNKLSGYAWFKDETISGRLDKTLSRYFKGRKEGHSPVGQKKPNPWGLYDVYGNVAEWVADVYKVDYYASSPAKDPQGPSPAPGLSRVYRGGGWASPAKNCRSAYRGVALAEVSMPDIGFRLAVTAE
ncbi:MAG: formylglycine-generating enzyme family protein [Deltaproteobacteria bacterium]|jgi:formylglycine-generating enzyme required for sulfatase activity|nr:formylglycine-generating enzyme family protein [Deltaproteobacteria bacterium]